MYDKTTDGQTYKSGFESEMVVSVLRIINVLSPRSLYQSLFKY